MKVMRAGASDFGDNEVPLPPEVMVESAGFVRIDSSAVKLFEIVRVHVGLIGRLSAPIQTSAGSVVPAVLLYMSVSTVWYRQRGIARKYSPVVAGIIFTSAVKIDRNTQSNYANCCCQKYNPDALSLKFFFWFSSTLLTGTARTDVIFAPRARGWN